MNLIVESQQLPFFGYCSESRAITILNALDRSVMTVGLFWMTFLVLNRDLNDVEIAIRRRKMIVRTGAVFLLSLYLSRFLKLREKMVIHFIEAENERCVHRLLFNESISGKYEESIVYQTTPKRISQKVRAFLLSVSKWHISKKCQGNAIVKAISKRNVKIVQALLAHGTLSGNNRYKVSLIAVGISEIKIVKALFAYGVISKHNKWTVILRAIRMRNIDAIQLLFAHSLISEVDKSKAFLVAVRAKDVKVVETLLAHGEAILENNLLSAIYIAILQGDLEMIKLLFEKCQIPDFYRLQALETASSSGHLQIVQFLFEDDQEVPKSHYDVALKGAMSHQHENVVEFLKESIIVEGEVAKLELSGPPILK